MEYPGYSAMKVRLLKKSRLIDALLPVLILLILLSQTCLGAGPSADPCAGLRKVPRHHGMHVSDNCATHCAGKGPCSISSAAGAMNVAPLWELPAPSTPPHNVTPLYMPSMALRPAHNGAFQTARVPRGRGDPVYLITLHFLC